MLGPFENKAQDVLGEASTRVAEAHLEAGSECICGGKPQMYFNMVVKTKPPQLLAFTLCTRCLAKPVRQVMKEILDVMSCGSQSNQMMM
ncbi:MAG: hypothetical protein KQH59_05255 [Desulfobulbaceae bacterium]|nr:hypothetical protein [Desulfobulbaceae bacterium]